ncbi:MAG: DnaJ domain-containing protein [archaeon]|nr:DnaJ domain-containing protein [archaeon]
MRKAYKKLAMKYHPDKNKSDNSDEIFKKLNDAFSVLGDDNKRKEYDFKNNCFDSDLFNMFQQYCGEKGEFFEALRRNNFSFYDIQNNSTENENYSRENQNKKKETKPKKSLMKKIFIIIYIICAFYIIFFFLFPMMFPLNEELRKYRGFH